MYQRPTLQDVIKAKRIIAPYIHRTPLHYYPSLSRLLEADTYVKHENHQVLGVFKPRGGINLVSQMDEESRRRGLVSASTGNHGQSIAYAGKVFGVKVVIGVPEGANPGKVESMESLGAEVVFHGREFDDAKEYIERLAAEEGYRYVHPGDEPLLIAGVATCTLEIIEDLPDVDVIIVPLGGGSGAAGACIVAKTVNPNIQVIAVQAEKAPAAYLSWKAGHLVEAPNETSAEGIATRTAFELPQSILRDLLDDFVLVSEREINQAIVLYLEKTHNLAEGAGAASLAGALKIRERLRGKKVALVLSGGNISLPQLRAALEANNLGP